MRHFYNVSMSIVKFIDILLYFTVEFPFDEKKYLI